MSFFFGLGGKATVGPSIAVIKKIAEKSGSGGGFKPVLLRKKRKGVALEENISDSETGDTTESESIDMEEECLVKKTSFDYDKSGTIIDREIDQTLKGLGIKTKKALDKPLRKINFSNLNIDDNILLNALLELFSLLKNLVPVSVRKSFALDIGLDKLMVVRRLFSKFNGFGGTSIPLKFSGIIHASFTSETSLAQATEKTRAVDILVNTNLKKSTGHLDQAVVLKKVPVGTSAETVCIALFKFGTIKSIKMHLVGLWQKAIVEFGEINQTDLVAACWFILIRKDAVHMARTNNDKKLWDAKDYHRALLYTLPMGTTAHNIWDFVGFVGGKTSRCAVVCFNSADSLDAVMDTTLVLRGVNLHWSHLSLSKCAKCENLGHTLLGCSVGGNLSSGRSSHRMLSNVDKSRLAAIYAKCSVPVTWPVAFGEIKPTLLVSLKINDRFATLEYSLASLAKCIDKLAKRLDTSEPTVFQFSPRCQPLVTPLSQNQGANIGMNESSGVVTSSEIVVRMVVFNSSVVLKIEETLRNLLVMVISLLAKIDNAGQVSVDDIICWHKDMGNLISVVIETKLKSRICSWIINKFSGIWVFTSGLDSGHMGAGIVVILNISLAKHVYKISEVFGWLLSIKLLFKNKLSVSVLGLYTGASSVINSFIVKTVNEFFFVILDGNFNKNGSHKCASFRKCLDLGLANSLISSLAMKLSIWANSWGVAKMIDYVFVSSNLVNTIVDHKISEVVDYFDINHKVVSIFIGLGGLLDTCLNSIHKQGADKTKWNDFKDATSSNTMLFSDQFAASTLILSANEIFKKRWFKGFDGVFTKDSSKFHKLELLVSKIVKASCLESVVDFDFFMECWAFLDKVKALTIQDLMDFGVGFDHVCSALYSVRKSYHASKLAESLRASETNIKSAIDKNMESFKTNKSHTIRSVLEHSFCKVVLDYLVVGDKLFLEPDEIKSKVDTIIEDWTKEQIVVDDLFNNWSNQYQPLEYVYDKTFFGIMQSIEFNELFGMVSDLPDGKAVGLSGIFNELWKYCDRSVLDMLLVLLNSCLSRELVLSSWKETWVSMILKPYEWEDVLTNTHPIALIEMAQKVLSKVFLDRILLACSTHNVLQENNFLVLKGTTIQTSIFAIGSVVEDALEKNCKLWLILQNMRKTYDLVGWKHLEKSLLSNGYRFYNSLDQGEVFLPLFWRIFYNSFLCEVKCQESVCRYRIIFHFISKNSCAESQAELSSFFVASAFVDDTIWVDSSQTATQHILNVASEFFHINNISINTNKTMVILINCKVASSFFFISGSPIFIAKKRDSHYYLGIFLSMEGLLKPSLIILDKQFLYLVTAVFHPIINYRTQFSFISINVYGKWNALICKDLKSKSGLLHNFPSNVIHHPSFYNLKTFKQIQSEEKLAFFVSFVNSDRILGHLFSHRSYDLQVLCWCPHYSLCFPVYLKINPADNFLVDMVRIFFGCDLSFGGSVNNSFYFWNGTSMLTVLGESKLDLRGLVPDWFKILVLFLVDAVLFFASPSFLDVDGSLRDLGLASCKASTAVFFENINLGLGMGVSGLVLSILAELQTIVLALNHSGVLGNEYADVLTNAASFFVQQLPPRFTNRYILADGFVPLIVHSGPKVTLQLALFQCGLLIL
ncbi:hypothetical protein G9A89_001547 [Geosiphon pyriformis]|nr:hypothetical protein G9A89_001547 [Geosiphon pyriformis]